MIGSFLFAQKLEAKLRHGAIDSSDRAFFAVTGRIDTKVVIAPVEILVPQNFASLRSTPPQVWCRRSWMREHADWHNSAESGMCWVLADEWRDAMAWEGKPEHAVIDEGHTWMLQAVACLINRHFLGQMERMTKWPDEWKSWKHFDKGSRQYEREKQRQQTAIVR